MHTSERPVSQSPRVQQHARSVDSLRQSGLPAGRGRSEESWVEIASQPSSSSLSSAADEIVTTGLRVEQNTATRRLRRTRPADSRRPDPVRAHVRSTGDISSQEEYEESESESDRVMTSSNEGLVMGSDGDHKDAGVDSDDENRTAVNYPIRTGNTDTFTPQPNAFSHPPTSRTMRHASEPCPGSYFPQMPSRGTARPTVRHSFSNQQTTIQHSPWNAISPSHNAAAHHDAALRASLSTLLSCAAAARGLPKSRGTQPIVQPRPSNRIESNTLRLVPGSALPGSITTPTPPALPTTRANLPAPNFLPTIRQQSSTATSESADVSKQEGGHKRKSRPSSKSRSVKKRRSSSASSASTVYSTEEMLVSPTLLTWVVSAGVVVVLSAISFTAGYAVGHEAGRVEGALGIGGGGEGVGSCASEVGRGMGLRRLRFAVQA